MNKQQKSRFRAARLIREALVQRRRDPANLQLPERHWADCTRTLGRIKHAARRGWHPAAAQLKRDLLREVDSYAAKLRELSLEMQELGSARSLPTIGDIYREMAALDAEFEDVQCDLAAGELCVSTPAVQLDGICLGPFQIRLDWNQLKDSSPYRIVALEPNPAISNEEVTHPHVSGEALCEGDGRPAIHAALEEGRLSDFFLLVWRLLDTYAPGRAYVELCDWHGSPCHECGTSVDEDDRCYCGRCDDLYCPECMSPCRHCDRDFCVGCISTCPSCCGSTCEGCREACISCGAMLCPDCLSEGDCESCREKEQNTEELAQVPACHEETPYVEEAGESQTAHSNLTL